MADSLKPDICVIGGGPGGIAVATAAANADVPVVLIEKGALGGASLTMAAPTQALIAAAGHHETLRRAPAFGVTGAPLQVNLARVYDHINATRDAIAANMTAERLTALGVTVIKAEGRFTSPRTVMAGDTAIRARRFVIATGARPSLPDYPGLADIDFLTLDTVFDSARKMTHLIVLGAGPRGLELAQAFNRLGVDSTVVDDGPALADEDPELASLVVDRLRAEGVRIRDRTRIVEFARRRGGVRVTLRDNDEADPFAVDGTHLLVATGSEPNVESLGLDAADIAHDPSGIAVNRQLKTANRRTYAIGDVVAGPTTVSRAEHQADLVLKSILYRLPVRYDPTTAPRLVSTEPQIASVGLVESVARNTSLDVRVLRMPFAENDLSQARRDTDGMIKAIATGRGRILGAAAVGPDASEVIAAWSLAMANRLPLSAMRSLLAPYPSRSDLSRRVAASFDGPGLTPLRQRRIIEFLRNFG